VESNCFIEILNAELVMAFGCTEPGAVAYAAALARKHSSGSEIRKIEVSASVDIIKNVAAVTIPGTNRCGMDLATALGIIIGSSEKKLEILSAIIPQDVIKAQELITQTPITVNVAQTPYNIYIAVTLETNTDQVSVVLAGHHTHLAKLEVDGNVLTDDFPSDDNNHILKLEKLLTIDNIWNFVQNIEMSNLDIIKRLIKINNRLGQEGLTSSYGLEVGRTILNNIGNGFLPDDLCSYAMALTSAGTDARMAGCSLPAFANSGSGNQGIQSSLPVVAIAQKLNKNEETTIRAVALSCLISIYVKSSFGRLSALCGATVAATGASSGIVYLLGGSLEQIKYTSQNMLGNVTGILCDGAKAGCALKIATCTSAAVQSALLSLNNIAIQSTDGIIEENIEGTIHNLGKISKIISNSTNKTILNIILDKKRVY